MAFHPVSEKSQTQTRIPGEPGIWAFVAGDLLVFSLFFILIAIGNQEQTEVFSSARSTLDLRFGLANTLLLLTGSFFAAIGVERYRLNDGRDNRVWFRLAILSGVIFLINKLFEWNAKVSDGLTPMTNDFFMFFFVFTAIHAIHVFVGVVILSILHKKSQSPFTLETQRELESGAIFWHLVDLLWIMLFALFYLV